MRTRTVGGWSRFLVLALCLWVWPAQAAVTWIVNTLGEPGGIDSAGCPVSCTLRDAINQALSGDTIKFAPGLSGQTITLTLSSNDPGCLTSGPTTCTSGTLGREFGKSAFFITGNRSLTIDGTIGLVNGMTITASGSLMRIFDIDSGSGLTLKGLTLANGTAEGGSSGFGGGALGAGGAIFNQGTLAISQCTFRSNLASGGSSIGGGQGLGNGGGGAGESPTSSNGGGPNGGAQPTFVPGSPGTTGSAGGFGGGGSGGGTSGTGTGGVGGAGGFGGGGGGGGDGPAFNSLGGNGGFGGGGGYGAGGPGPAGFGSGTAASGSGGAGMGGAIFNDAGIVTITNSTFSQNTAWGGGVLGNGLGGAIFNYDGTLILDFVTLAGNTVHNGAGASGSDGGAIYSLGDSLAACSAGGNTSCLTSGATLTMNNSIAALNTDVAPHDIVTNAINGGGNVSNGAGNLIMSNLGFAGTIVSGADPQISSLAYYGGLTQTMLPGPTSPVIDAVTCDATTTDQRGVSRPRGVQCDIGAVEVSELCYVKFDASGANDGAHWATAYTNLQSALASSFCPSIWVARGTYHAATSDRMASFVVSPGRAVYGGFAGNETQVGQRNAAANRTILSGDIGTAGNSADNSYHVVFIDTSAAPVDTNTILDGFEITGGNANGSSPDDSGAGLYCNGSGSGHACDPTLANLYFAGNSAAAYGGAIYLEGSALGSASPIIAGSTFRANTAGIAGGAVADIANASGNSNAVYSNDTFVGNSANYGGAVYSDGTNTTSTTITLNGVTFTGNSATTGGGAIYDSGCTGQFAVAVTNSILWADSGPGGLAEIDHSCGTNGPTIKGSIVAGSNGSGLGWNTQLGTDGGGNQDADPLFGLFQYNGGFTPTVMIGSGGAAISGGNDAACLATDQRGVGRPQGPHCDDGAVERKLLEDAIFNNAFEQY